MERLRHIRAQSIQRLSRPYLPFEDDATGHVVQSLDVAAKSKQRVENRDPMIARR